MIQVKKIACTTNANAKNLVLIPGGPGLSSNTLRSLDLLSRSFHLHYVDFPGTNGNPYDHKRTFEELSDQLQKVIQSLDGKTIILGHSFGGFYAAYTALWSEAEGLICLSVPFSHKSLEAVNYQYALHMTPELKEAESSWEKQPNDETFRRWLASYGKLYFSSQNGKELILNDSTCFQSFLDNREDANQMESLLSKTSQNPIKKLFVAGLDDVLLPVEVLKEEASRGGFSFEVISNASHFSMFDQPESVARLIEKYFAMET